MNEDHLAVVFTSPETQFNSSCKQDERVVFTGLGLKVSANLLKYQWKSKDVSDLDLEKRLSGVVLVNNLWSTFCYISSVTLILLLISVTVTDVCFIKSELLPLENFLCSSVWTLRKRKEINQSPTINPESFWNHHRELPTVPVPVIPASCGPGPLRYESAVRNPGGTFWQWPHVEHLPFVAPSRFLQLCRICKYITLSFVNTSRASQLDHEAGCESVSHSGLRLLSTWFYFWIFFISNGLNLVWLIMFCGYWYLSLICVLNFTKHVNCQGWSGGWPGVAQAPGAPTCQTPNVVGT